MKVSSRTAPLLRNMVLSCACGTWRAVRSSAAWKAAKALVGRRPCRRRRARRRARPRSSARRGRAGRSRRAADRRRRSPSRASAATIPSAAWTTKRRRAAGGEHPQRLGHRLVEVRIFDPVLADHRAEAAVGEGQGLDIGLRHEADRRHLLGVAGDEGGRVDRRLVDRDDLEAAALRGDQGGGAVAGAEVEDARAVRQAGEEGAPAVGDAGVVIAPRPRRRSRRRCGRNANSGPRSTCPPRSAP